MINLRMKEKLKNGEARDVSAFTIGRGRYKLPAGWYRDDVDYCDAKRGAWIWSVGRELSTGNVYASTSGEYYQNPLYECLWLR